MTERPISADDERSDHTATVRLLLEDVTPEEADEFFERLAGRDITITLGNGVEYVAEVVSVLEDA
jgi:hypothetical protein